MGNSRGAECGNRNANKGNMVRNSGWFPCFVFIGYQRSLYDGGANRVSLAFLLFSCEDS